MSADIPKRPGETNPDMRARKILKLWGASSVACLLASCAVGPDYKGPPRETLRSFKNNSGEAGKWKVAEPRDFEARGAWWEVFHDSTLNELENHAAHENQDISGAIARIREAQSQTRVAAADFLPSLSAEPSATRQRSSNTDPYQTGRLIGPNPFAGPSGSGASGNSGDFVLNNQPLTRTYNLFRLPLDLSWEIDLFGRVRRNTEAARATAQASVADYQNTLVSVTANVASTYFSLRALDEETVVLESTIKTRRDALQIAQERLDAGLTGELDVARAKSEAASNEADLFSVRRARGEMENALATLTGQSASAFQLGRGVLGSNPPRIPTGLPSRLLERRPDIASAERQLAAANARVGLAKAAFFPEIKLTGLAGLESADVGSLFSWQSRVWQIGPSISLPIFEGGRNHSQSKRKSGALR